MDKWLKILLLATPWTQSMTAITFSIPTPRSRRYGLSLNNRKRWKDVSTAYASKLISHGHDSFVRTAYPLHGQKYRNFTRVESISNELDTVPIKIVKSFAPSKYNPYILLRNPHIQTILGVFLRRNPYCTYIPKPTQELDVNDELQEALHLLPLVFQRIITGLIQTFIHLWQTNNANKSYSFWDERERIETADGDFFHVDYKWNNKNNEGKENIRHMIIILHGLESSSNSPLSIDMADAFSLSNFDVAFINFRGCSGVPNDTLGGYHAGFTDDLLLFLSIIRTRYGDGISLYLSGFSLGSNVVVKCLGELGIKAVSEFNIQGAAVMGCPFDLNIQYRRLVDDPFNRLVYTRTLLRTLKEKATHNLHKHCDGDESTSAFDYKKCRDANTIVGIEEGLIVPVFGFQDKFDYYNKSASISVMKDIAVPTLIINAADDPFFDSNYFPWDQDCDYGGSAPIKLIRTESGGHLGYIFHVESRSHEIEAVISSSSWICNELARFVKHVRDYKM